jgi:hypothetical protein
MAIAMPPTKAAMDSPAMAIVKRYLFTVPHFSLVDLMFVDADYESRRGSSSRTSNPRELASRHTRESAFEPNAGHQQVTGE